MAEERPGFTHRPARHGLIGPFGGRQIAAGFAIVVVAAVVLMAVSTPLGSTAAGGPPDPKATPYVIGAATEGLRPGDLAPEFTGTRADGTAFGLTDLDGRPVRLADLRGKGVWITFWASWCPPCQAETPVLRDTYAAYRDRGLELVAVSVQESSAADVAAYAKRYALAHTIGNDASGDVFHLYRVFALPTQLFVGPDGVIRSVVQGPLDAAGAARHIEAILPAGHETTAPTAAP